MSRILIVLKHIANQEGPECRVIDGYGEDLQCDIRSICRDTLTELAQANAREREAFMAGFKIFPHESVDAEQKWQQHRCQDDTDWKQTTEAEAQAIDESVLGDIK